MPDGVLFGSSKAHKELRRILVEDQQLKAVVKLPSGVFKPYAGVSTAILLPDCLERWANRESTELQRKRTDQSFCVPKADIVTQGYDLSLNRYKEVVHDEIEHRPPPEIIADLEKLEAEIQHGLADLKAMLG